MSEIDSKRLIANSERRFKELERKGWDRASFYNGWLECFGEYCAKPTSSAPDDVHDDGGTLLALALSRKVVENLKVEIKTKNAKLAALTAKVERRDKLLDEIEQELADNSLQKTLAELQRARAGQRPFDYCDGQWPNEGNSLLCPLRIVYSGRPEDSLTVREEEIGPDEFVKAWQSEAEPDDYDKASAYYHFRGSWQHTAAESGWHFRRYTPPARKE